MRTREELDSYAKYYAGRHGVHFYERIREVKRKTV